MSTTITSLKALLTLSESQADSPNTRHLNYTKHIHQVEMVNNVYEGIDSVVAADYLFKFPQETDTTFDTRAERATLRNFVKRAVEAFTGMIFRKPIDVEGYGARTTRSFQKIDTHQDIGGFTKDITTSATKDGKSYILIDSARDGSIPPYFVHIERSQLINWRTDENGKYTMIVIEEVVSNPVGEFGTDYVVQWRHYKDDGAITIYQQDGKDIVLVERIQSDYIGIPLVEVDVDDTPILYDTAKLNIKHFNRLSHKDRYLTMAALPIPVIWGADIDDDGNTTTATPALVIGVDEAFIFSGTKQEADFEWRELSGDSIDQLEKDLDSIVEDITTGILRAAESSNAVQKTATEVALLQAEASDRVSAIAIAVESAMRDALVILSEFNNETVPSTAKFIISKDFSSALAGTDGQRIVMEAYLQGLVSIETFLQSLADAELISIESTSKEIDKIKADTFVPKPKTNELPATDNRTVGASNAE